jgi:hypothetical protein
MRNSDSRLNSLISHYSPVGRFIDRKRPGRAPSSRLHRALRPGSIEWLEQRLVMTGTQVAQTLYVNHDWANFQFGQEFQYTPPNATQSVDLFFGLNAFATIQDAVANFNNTDFDHIEVDSGNSGDTYSENVTINQDVTMTTDTTDDQPIRVGRISFTKGAELVTSVGGFTTNVNTVNNPTDDIYSTSITTTLAGSTPGHKTLLGDAVNLAEAYQGTQAIIFAFGGTAATGNYSDSFTVNKQVSLRGVSAADPVITTGTITLTGNASTAESVSFFAPVVDVNSNGGAAPSLIDAVNLLLPKNATGAATSNMSYTSVALNVSPGTYAGGVTISGFTLPVVASAVGGSPSSPVTVGSAAFASSGNGSFLVNNNNVTISGFTLTGTGGDGGDIGVSETGKNNLSLTNNSVSSFTTGVSLTGGGTNTLKGTASPCKEGCPTSPSAASRWTS